MHARTANAIGDDFDNDHDLDFPRRWHAPPAHPRPAFVSVHGVCQSLTARIDAELRPHGISATEAIVLVTVRSDPGAAIATIRHATGFRPSSLAAVVDRLERKGTIRRVRSDADHRYVGLVLTGSGEDAALAAEAAFGDVDAELGVFASREMLAALQHVHEAARILGWPAQIPDY
jgi:DNA-binding MarR family transcriptional regulator